MKILTKLPLTHKSLETLSVLFLILLPLAFFWRQTLGWLVLADGDATFWFYPAYQFVVEELKQGRLPLWNPYLYGGMPSFGQWQAGVLDPLNWIFLLGLTARTFTLAQQLTFSLALVGMYGYVRQLACRRRAAVFAAVIYALSGFAVERTIYPNVFHIFALAPWIFLFLERLALQRRWRDAALGALFVAWQICAAHPQLILYTATLAAAYALFRMNWRARGLKAWLEQNRRFAGQALGVYLGGLGLAAWQLLPVLESASQSVRQEWPYEIFTYNSLHPISLLGALFPYLHGQGRGIYHLPYWGVYWHQIEAAIYLGTIGLSCALVCSVAAWRWRWPFARFWSVVALAGLLLALGRYVPPLAHVLYHVPLWGKLRSPNRHWFEVIFAVAVLSGLLMNHCLAGGRDKVDQWLTQALTRTGCGLTCLVVVVGWLGLWRPNLMQVWLRTLPDLQNLPPNFLHGARAEFWVPMLVVPLAALALAWFARAPQRRSRYALLLAAVLLDFQLQAHYAPISNGENLSELLGKGLPPALMGQEKTEPPFRLHQMLPPNGNEFNPFGMYGYEFIGGYDPMLNSRYKTFARIDEAGRSYAPTLLMPQDPTLDFLNVRYVLLSPTFIATQTVEVSAALQDTQRWREVPNENTLRWYKDHKVYENLRAQPRVWLVGAVQVVRDEAQQLQRLRGELKDAQGRLFDPQRLALVDEGEPHRSGWVDWQRLGLQGDAAEPFAVDSAKILERRPGRLLIETEAARAALLVISEMAYTGWQATLDGQAVAWQRVNYMLCGVPLAAGKHRIEFVYRPRSVKIGAAVSFTTALVLLGVFVWDWRKRR